MSGSAPRWSLSLRLRVVLALLTLIVVVLGATIVLSRAVLTTQASQAVARQLRGEVAELRLLAERGLDPQTGQPFADPEALLRLNLQRSIPEPGESLMIVVDGEVVARSDDVPVYRLASDRQFLAVVGGATDVVYGRYATPAGQVRYAAVPIGGGSQGAPATYVVAQFVSTETVDAVTRALLVSALVLGIPIVVVAWLLAGRALRPVRGMAATASSINAANLQGRMVPRHAPGSRLWDEFDELSGTVNEMLDRLETAFAGQRRFLDEAGHELRTPMTVIRGYLELIEDDPQSLPETVEVVSDELDRMGRLVADLQVLASSARPDFLQPGPVDVGELVGEVLGKAATLADRDWRCDQVVSVQVWADRHRLTQALLELANNAARLTGPGDQIGIGADRVAGEVRLWVRDAGPGVDPELAGRIFERFVHRPGSPGSGLGLSIVAAIAAGHGGRVEVLPEEPHGARFVLCLPDPAASHPASGRESS